MDPRPRKYQLQRRQMSTRRHSPNTDPVGIKIVLRCVSAKPAHGSLTIFDLRRKRGSPSQPVIDAGHSVSHPALERQRDTAPFCHCASLRHVSKRSLAADPRPSQDNRGPG
jgi:hypothetical protein